MCQKWSHWETAISDRSYTLATPRRTSLPLKGQIEAELKCMEIPGVICKVDVLTDWCAECSCAENNMICICVDLTQLNKSVCCERHTLPSVEQRLAQLQELRY